MRKIKKRYCAPSNPYQGDGYATRTKEFKALVRVWQAKLEKAGYFDIEGTTVKGRVSTSFRKDKNSGTGTMDSRFMPEYYKHDTAEYYYQLEHFVNSDDFTKTFKGKLSLYRKVGESMAAGHGVHVLFKKFPNILGPNTKYGTFLKKAYAAHDEIEAEFFKWYYKQLDAKNAEINGGQ